MTATEIFDFGAKRFVPMEILQIKKKDTIFFNFCDAPQAMPFSKAYNDRSQTCCCRLQCYLGECYPLSLINIYFQLRLTYPQRNELVLIIDNNKK